MAVAARCPRSGVGQRTTLWNRTWAKPPASTSPASPNDAAAGWLNRPNTTNAIIACVPTTPPRFPSATSSPPASAQTASRPKCSHTIDPVTHPTNVEIAITVASVASSAIGGRPPPTRQAIPTSIAPAPIVTPATELHTALPMPRTATTGIAASRPA